MEELLQEQQEKQIHPAAWSSGSWNCNMDFLFVGIEALEIVVPSISFSVDLQLDDKSIKKPEVGKKKNKSNKIEVLRKKHDWIEIKDKRQHLLEVAWKEFPKTGLELC